MNYGRRKHLTHTPIGAYIACAHDDMLWVRKIYQEMWARGIDLTLHVENILVGHDPRRATADAVRSASVVIVCLTRNSTQNSGELAYELKFVLSLVENQTVIGVTAEPVPIPDLLENCLMIDIANADGYVALASAITERAGLIALEEGDAWTTRPRRLFISYSHRDEELRDDLVKHLTSLKREGLIEIWHDRDLTPGTNIDDAISDRLASADIVLILVSPDFIASEYCYSTEMRKAMGRFSWGECLVVPIILRPVDWHNTPFAKLLALPTDGKPITMWDNRDQAFTQVVDGIRRLVQSEHHIHGHR